MKIIIDIGHPAHVHYFKNFYKIMKSKGHEFLITARDKEVTHELLNAYKIPFISRGKGKNSTLGKILYIFYADCLIINKARKFKPDYFIGFSSLYAAHAAKYLGIPSITYDDTEHAKYELMLYRPYTTYIFTPISYTEDIGKKQFRFKSYMELAYLHKNYFRPNEIIYNYLGIKQNIPYVILRFVSWSASHDKGQFGLDTKTKIKIIERLRPFYKIFISSEGDLPNEFEQYRIKIPAQYMHDALAFADIFIGEGATMASECAILGTPAIYVNSLDLGYLCEHERNGLIAGFKQSEGVFEKLEDWLSNKQLKIEISEKRNKIIDQMIDPTKMLIWFVENYPNSARTLKENPQYQINFK